MAFPSGDRRHFVRNGLPLLTKDILGVPYATTASFPLLGAGASLIRASRDAARPRRRPCLPPILFSGGGLLRRWPPNKTVRGTRDDLGTYPRTPEPTETMPLATMKQRAATILGDSEMQSRFLFLQVSRCLRDIHFSLVEKRGHGKGEEEGEEQMNEGYNITPGI
ncbi:hypothetical protein EJB05_08049, partial [Eragrostis curvula]